MSGVEGEEYKKMTQQGLEQFGAYQKARQLFDLVSEEVIQERIKLLDEIIGILTNSIAMMRKGRVTRVE